MDNLTHSLFALTLAATPLGRAGRGSTLALLLASNAPDIDVVAAVSGGGASYLSAHRGTSHGPVGVLGLGLVAAALVYAGLRWQRWRRGTREPATGDASWWALAGLALVGSLSHVLMDLPTSYGTRSLSPFDWTWYAVDLLPIIDVYLWMLLGAGLVAVRMAPGRRAAIASTVLVLMLANYGLRFALHDRALQIALDGRAAIPGVLSAWSDAPQPKLPSDFVCDESACALATAALPTFGSPFRWRVVRQFSNGYRVSDVDVRRTTEREVEWIPHDADSTLDAARLAPAAATFLAFSRFPTAEVVRGGLDTIVRLRDMRFLDRPIPARGEEFRPGGLFNVVVRLNPDGRVVEDRFGN